MRRLSRVQWAYSHRYLLVVHGRFSPGTDESWHRVRATSGHCEGVAQEEEVAQVVVTAQKKEEASEVGVAAREKEASKEEASEVGLVA